MVPTEVSGDHFCAACHFLSCWRLQHRGPCSFIFYGFLFLIFFTSCFSPVGRGRWGCGVALCNGPLDPPTPQHTCSQWGLCNTAPKTYSCLPPKTGNQDLPRSCFSTNFLLSCPFHRLFSLFSLSGSPQIRSLIYISSCSYGNQLL